MTGVQTCALPISEIGNHKFEKSRKALFFDLDPPKMVIYRCVFVNVVVV